LTLLSAGTLPKAALADGWRRQKLLDGGHYTAFSETSPSDGAHNQTRQNGTNPLKCSSPR
jgi:hypothetical protein